ncbi:MAG: amidase family protein [Bacteroidota bacterium]|nr:aspartyl/glutamyl-tRNA amidotransferase subunit A [Rhodothermia bacterium]MDW8285044.1 amidase family protein [Bacteroidota bacterium]
MTTYESLRTALERGEITLRERVQLYLDRIAERNPELNAFLDVWAEEALQEAERIEARIRRKEAGPLAGMVVAIKDNIAVRGRRLTCASRMLEGFQSLYDATVVARLREADALLIGKTNLDEFAMGSSNENSAFGPVRNPHRPEYVPGGSSGGSAAAVAARLCDAALGSDTGGSIRLPAALCGVVGLKPSYGRVSRFGLVAFASSLDCIGPMARTVEEVARLLEVIAGPDPQDATSMPHPVPRYAELIQSASVRGLRIGLPREYYAEGLDPEIRWALEELARALEQEGAQLRAVSLPHTEYGIATYYILATAEASSNLARYDGIHYGYRAPMEAVMASLGQEAQALREALERARAAGDEEAAASYAERLENPDSPLVRLYKLSRTQGFGTEVKRRIMLGTYVLSAGYYEAYYGKAQRVRRLIQEDFMRAFEEVDVLLVPPAPTPGFKLGERLQDPLQMYLADVYTVTANLAGVPGLVVPIGWHSWELPIGAQLLGRPFEEERLLQLGRILETLRGGGT